MKIENLERINELIQERRNVEEYLDVLKAIKGKLVTSGKDGYDFNVTIDGGLAITCLLNTLRYL